MTLDLIAAVKHPAKGLHSDNWSDRLEGAKLCNALKARSGVCSEKGGANGETKAMSTLD